jgi:Mg2+ and Co2+ transporter CorA
LRTIFAYNEHEVKTDGSIDALGSGYNVWIDLIDFDHDELFKLAHKFSLDAEAIETYINKSKKAEIRLLDNHTFTVVLDIIYE